MVCKRVVHTVSAWSSWRFKGGRETHHLEHLHLGVLIELNVVNDPPNRLIEPFLVPHHCQRVCHVDESHWRRNVERSQTRPSRQESVPQNPEVSSFGRRLRGWQREVTYERSFRRRR